MTPKLFAQNESSFAGHGIGPLKEATRCTVREELNGSYELTLELPAESRRFDAIGTRMLVLAKPNPYDQPQPFRIYRETRPTNLLFSAAARHISYDLDGIPVSDFTAANAAQAVQRIKNNSLLNNPFSFSTDMSETREMKVEVPTAARALLGENMPSLLKIYGGELQYDRFSVSLLNRRGADRGVTIAYGRNLVDVDQERNIGELYTGVLPYYIGRDDEGEDVKVTGSIQNAAGSFGYSRIKPVDLSAEFDETPTVAQLNSAGQAYITREKIGVPQVSLRVTTTPPGSTGLHALEDIRLGDTVRVRFERLGIDVTSRVIAYTYDVLNERYLSIEIGTMRETITAAMRDAKHLETGTIPPERFAPGSIRGGGGGAIKKGSITDADIKLASLTGRVLAAGAVGIGKIAELAVEKANLAVNSVDSTKIEDDSILSSKIKDGAVSKGKIAANSIDSARLEDDAVTNAKISNGAIGESKIATDAITNTKIKNGEVIESKIATDAVTNTKIKNSAVEENKIAAAAVTNTKIAGLAVSKAKIADGAVEEDKIGALAVTTGKIAGAAVTYAKAAFTGTLDQVGVNKSNIESIQAMFTGSLHATNVYASLVQTSSLTFAGYGVGITVIDGHGCMTLY